MTNRTEIPKKFMPVAVTGMGMICPLGISSSLVWQNMLAAKSGIKKITKFDTSGCLTRIGGELPPEYFKMEAEKTLNRFVKQTVRAARIIWLCSNEAIQDSSFKKDKLDFYRCGVIIGTSGSSVRGPEDIGDPNTKRFKVIREMINALPAWISLENGFKGSCLTISAGYASGAYAICRAYDLIRWGMLDVVVVGGVDYLLTENNIKRGNLLNVLSTRNDSPQKAVRPFDKHRDGWVLSDGGCAVVLESYEHALKRNAPVYAWMRGYGAYTDGKKINSYTPNSESMATTIEQALKNADISHKKVGYVNANGTSSVWGDRFETAAIKKVLGNQAYDLLISSTKSMIGHCVGGADCIDFAVTALALKTKNIPPTINYEFPDPDCDLNYVPNTMVSKPDLEVAITNSFDPRGHCCVIVLSGQA